MSQKTPQYCTCKNFTCDRENEILRLLQHIPLPLFFLQSITMLASFHWVERNIQCPRTANDGVLIAIAADWGCIWRFRQVYHQIRALLIFKLFAAADISSGEERASSSGTLGSFGSWSSMDTSTGLVWLSKSSRCSAQRERMSFLSLFRLVPSLFVQGAWNGISNRKQPLLPHETDAPYLHQHSFGFR